MNKEGRGYWIHRTFLYFFILIFVLKNKIPMLLNENKDPMGTAIQTFFETGKAQKLKVLSTMFDDDEIPVPYLFRTSMEMGQLERLALSLSSGRILDVGAGAGCHALALQEQGADVTAIDISPLSVETMRRRGIRQVEWTDFFTADFPTPFDTILMLMNGIGIVGKVANLPHFFHRLDSLLASGGCVITDSSDLRYIFEDEDGNFDAAEFEGYYGEVDYQMRYGKITGDRFDWLYLDEETLRREARNSGYRVEILQKGEHYDYLAKITKI